MLFFLCLFFFFFDLSLLLFILFTYAFSHSFPFLSVSLLLFFCFAYASGIQVVALSSLITLRIKKVFLSVGRQPAHGESFSLFSIPGSLIFVGILLRLPTTRIHSVNSCPALSHTQASAFSGETLAVLSAGISKRWPKYRLPIDIARPRSETPFPRL